MFAEFAMYLFLLGGKRITCQALTITIKIGSRMVVAVQKTFLTKGRSFVRINKALCV